MILALLSVVACSDPVTITPAQDGCTDYNFESPAASTVDWEASDDGGARVWRSNDLQAQSGLLFDPNITSDGGVVSVFEAWSGGESDDAFCYEPSIELENLNSKVQVRWYAAEDDTEPFATVNVVPS